MDAYARRRALALLVGSRDDVATCRDVEAVCHAASTSRSEYEAHVLRAAYNLMQNPLTGRDVVCTPDCVLTRGTLMGRIQDEQRARKERFERMLEEKYEALNDQTFQAIVRCRRCGSEEVTWEEKQTRSADEGATIFCACVTCKNRWVMR